MVIGSDVGTTITVILGGLKGTPAKKRVALSHFLFNVITAILGLIFLNSILALITEVIGISNQLLALVTFHSVFNFLGILVIYPFLGVFAKFLESILTGDDSHACIHINKLTADVPEAAITAIRAEVKRLIEHVFILNFKVLKIKTQVYNQNISSDEASEIQELMSVDSMKIYEKIKQIEGEMIPFYLSVQNQVLEDDESNTLGQLIHATQHCIMAAKSVKDIVHNIEDLNRSSNDQKVELLEFLTSQLEDLYMELYSILHSSAPEVYFESLLRSVRKNQIIYDKFVKKMYRSINRHRFSEIDISTMLNVNREIYNSNHALIMAITDTLLDPEKAESFSLASRSKLHYSPSF